MLAWCAPGSAQSHTPAELSCCRRCCAHSAPCPPTRIAAEGLRLRRGGDAAAQAAPEPSTARWDSSPSHGGAASCAGAGAFGSGGFRSTSAAGAARFSNSTSRPGSLRGADRGATAAAASAAAAAAWGWAGASARGGEAAGHGCAACSAAAAGQPVEIRRPGAGEEARVVLRTAPAETRKTQATVPWKALTLFTPPFGCPHKAIFLTGVGVVRIEALST